jgi:hypothetical protein
MYRNITLGTPKYCFLFSIGVHLGRCVMDSEAYSSVMNYTLQLFGLGMILCGSSMLGVTAIQVCLCQHLEFNSSPGMIVWSVKIIET